MSDFTEYSEFYKRAWERSLSERTTELQKEIETLRAENARYREALEFYVNTGNWSFASSGDYAYHETLEDDATFFSSKTSGYYAGRRAREALMGKKT